MHLPNFFELQQLLMSLVIGLMAVVVVIEIIVFILILK